MQRRALIGPMASGPGQDLFFSGATVFTGKDRTLLRSYDVWVSDGKIRAVVPVGRQSPPSGAKVIDAAGLTLLPGLIDTHVHVIGMDAPPWKKAMPDSEHFLQEWLYAGITTVYDMGGTPKDLEQFAEKTESGALAGPRIFHTHVPITAPGGHPVPAIGALAPWPLSWWMKRSTPQLAQPQDALPLIRQAKAEGARYVKLICDELPPGAPKLDAARVRAIVDAAHSEGLKVFAHIGSEEDALTVVRAGADHLAHGVYKGAISEELIRELRTRGVGVTYTAAGFVHTRQMAEGRFEPSEFAREVSPDGVLTPVTGSAGSEFARLPVLGEFSRTIASEDVFRDNIARLHRAGVRIYPGSDSPIAAVLPGSSLHDELALFSQAGIPRSEVLMSATGWAAKLFLDNPDFGTLEAGKAADLIAVPGDPTQDLDVLKKIRYLVRQGKLVPRIPWQKSS